MTTSITALEVESLPEIDGIADESLINMSQLSISKDFVLIGPDVADTRPDFEGTVAVGYCKEGLYFVGRVSKKRSDVFSSALRKDSVWPYSGEDCIFLFLDASRDRRNAFFFGINANNTKADGIITAEGGFDYGWDADWLSGVKISDEVLTYEIFIPWKSISLKRKTDRMGLNIVIPSFNPAQTASWARCYRSLTEVSVFNDLILPRPVEQEIVLSLRPQSRYHGERVGEDRMSLVRGGFDLLFRSGAIADCVITVRPDFAEAEPDADQIILEKELQRYLPEKRLFFQMGLGLLDSRVFYTRRIEKIDYGAKAQGEIGSADYALFAWRGWHINASRLDGIFGATSFDLRQRVNAKAVAGVYRMGDRWSGTGEVDILAKMGKALSIGGNVSLHNEDGQATDSTLYYKGGIYYNWQSVDAFLSFHDCGPSVEPSTGFAYASDFEGLSAGIGKSGRFERLPNSYWSMSLFGGSFTRQNGRRYKSQVMTSFEFHPSEKAFFYIRPDYYSIVFGDREYINRVLFVCVSYGKSAGLGFESTIGESFGADVQHYVGHIWLSHGSWLNFTFSPQQLRQHWHEGGSDKQVLVDCYITLRPKEWLLLRSFAEYSEISNRIRMNGMVVFDPAPWKVVLAASHDHPTESSTGGEESANLVFKVSYNIQIR